MLRLPCLCPRFHQDLLRSGSLQCLGKVGWSTNGPAILGSRPDLSGGLLGLLPSHHLRLLLRSDILLRHVVFNVCAVIEAVSIYMPLGTHLALPPFWQALPCFLAGEHSLPLLTVLEGEFFDLVLVADDLGSPVLACLALLAAVVAWLVLLIILFFSLTIRAVFEGAG